MEKVSRLKSDCYEIGKIVYEHGLKEIEDELEILLQDSQVSRKTVTIFFKERLKSYVNELVYRKKKIDKTRNHLLWVVGGIIVSGLLYYHLYRTEPYTGTIGRLILALGFGFVFGGPLFILFVMTIFPSLFYDEGFEGRVREMSRLLDSIEENYLAMTKELRDI